MTARALSLAVALTFAAGCYYKPALTTKPYTPQEMTVPNSAGEILAVVRKLVDDQGWWIAREDAGTGRLVALSATESGDGLVTRDRWVFTVTDGRLSVQHFLDHVQGGTWRTTEAVCDTYEYTAEQAQLAAVEARLTLRRAAAR